MATYQHVFVPASKVAAKNPVETVGELPREGRAEQASTLSAIFFALPTSSSRTAETAVQPSMSWLVLICSAPGLSKGRRVAPHRHLLGPLVRQAKHQLMFDSFQVPAPQCVLPQTRSLLCVLYLFLAALLFHLGTAVLFPQVLPYIAAFRRQPNTPDSTCPGDQ